MGFKPIANDLRKSIYLKMLKKITLLLLLSGTCIYAKAQTADQIFDYYLEMDMARTKGDMPRALEFGKTILPNVDKLPAKYKISYYYSLGKIYDDSFQADKAIIYYDKVLAAQPNYFVPHLALGYIYYNKASEISKKLQTAKNDAKLATDYNATILKALPHLEKAQACDPNDETLKIIKMLYSAVKDTAGLNSLPTRLAAMSKNCISVLTE